MFRLILATIYHVNCYVRTFIAIQKSFSAKKVISPMFMYTFCSRLFMFFVFVFVFVQLDLEKGMMDCLYAKCEWFRAIFDINIRHSTTHLGKKLWFFLVSTLRCVRLKHFSWINEGTPCITDCVMAELEKLGQKYRVALRYILHAVLSKRWMI